MTRHHQQTDRQRDDQMIEEAGEKREDINKVRPMARIEQTLIE
jgi:hypothetical protein